MFVPRCIVSVASRISILWVSNLCNQSVVLPRGMRLVLLEADTSISINALSNAASHEARAHKTSPGVSEDSSPFLNMVNKALFSDKRLASASVLSKHASLFAFTRDATKACVPSTRARHSIDTDFAHPVR